MLQRGHVIDERAASPAADIPFARLVDLQLIQSSSGTLGIAESSKHIGFPVLRTYFLTNVPEGGGRGGHAHKTLKQCFICLRGHVAIALSKGDDTVTVRMSSFSKALVVDAGCWRDLFDFSEDAMVLVLASQPYDEGDYIRDYAEFLDWQAANTKVGVPYIDLTRNSPEDTTAIYAAFDAVMRSGYYIGGPHLTKFEQEFGRYCGVKHAIGVGNGLDALALVLQAWGVGPGDEVIVPAHTFIATALAVDKVGAAAVLVDVEPGTGLLDPAKLESALTPQTKAIIPVHLYGQSVDIDAIRSVIGQRNIKILEDAAQAHGATYKSRRCGALGDAATFSFYPTKNLGAIGDGGAVVTNDDQLAAAVRRLANYGSAHKYQHEVVGSNSRLDPVQAAILSAKLPSLDGRNARRAHHAAAYMRGLADLDGLILPEVRSYASPVWHVFSVRAPGRRDELMAFLNSRNIGTNIHYPTPVHKQACYAGRWPGQTFLVAETLAAESLSLPLDSEHTDAEIEQVIAAVRKFFRSVAGAAAS